MTTNERPETVAELKARHAQELRKFQAEQRRIERELERRDDQREKHLAKWLRRYDYATFTELGDLRDAVLEERREKGRSRVQKHRDQGVAADLREGVTQGHDDALHSDVEERYDALGASGSDQGHGGGADC